MSVKCCIKYLTDIKARLIFDFFIVPKVADEKWLQTLTTQCIIHLRDVHVKQVSATKFYARDLGMPHHRCQLFCIVY